MEHSKTRKVVFHLAALNEVRATPKSIRVACGEMLRLLQEGVSLRMPASRPMPVIAPGVAELRARESSGEYRTFYLAKSSEGILVLRVFHKKSQATPLTEIRLARRRLQELLRESS